MNVFAYKYKLNYNIINYNKNNYNSLTSHQEFFFIILSINIIYILKIIYYIFFK